MNVASAPDQESSLEFYLTSNEAGRVCYPTKKPWPLPVHRTLISIEDVEGASMSAEVFNDLSPRIQKMLQERYDHLSTTVVHNWQWIFDDEPKRHVVTVYTTADWDSGIWLQAVEDIYRLLRANGLPSDTTVELTNESQLNYKKITAEPVPQSDREFYSKIEKGIFKILLDELETALVYAGLHMYSEASSISTLPCLFIFVRPGSVFEWKSLSAKTHQLLPEVHFKLQFRPGRYVPLAREAGRPSPSEFDSGLRTGASISRMDDHISSGTSGVFFDLKIDRSPPPTRCNLTPGVYKALATCHHIIEPLEGTPNYQEALSHGYPLPSNPQDTPQVVCPSHQHVQQSISMLEANISANMRDMESFSSNRQLMAFLKSDTKTVQEELQSRRQLGSRAPIGKVLFSTMHVSNKGNCRMNDPSDCWYHDHFLMDVALIQLWTTQNPQKNQAPLLRQGHPMLWFDVLGDVQGIAQPQYAMKVFKCGSESHITSGMLSGQRWICSDAMGWFQAWFISPLGERSFSVGGDSASLITTQSGAELVGQLQGGLVDQAGEPLTCMTPIEPIMDFIKAQMPGSELTLSTETPSVVETPLQKIRKFLVSVGSRLPGREQDDSMV
ncbi:MAG: hypothetical protein LQ346_007217 [Caloplaca aetnensis]|nr:MAG: hypothetical protein LQ346_007217 [Caloplaca aetnensis]